MSDKMKNIPKLRFPEFLNELEWKEKKIKNIFSIFQGYAFSSNDSVTDGVRWLKIADVDIQQMNCRTPSFLPHEFVNKYNKFLVKKGDYVIALTRPILNNKLKIAKIDATYDGALLNQRVGKILTKENSHFVYFLLQKSDLISEIENSISGSEPPNLSAQQIENIIVHIPLIDEQQKIADCLSSLDSIISTQSQRIELLKEHKKGLLQNLFPRDGENVPKFRFPEFKNNEVWEEKKLSDLIYTITPPKKLLTNQYLDKGSFPIIDQSQKYIVGWTNDKESIIREKLPLIIFGDHTCALKLINQPFAQGADGIKIFEANSQYLTTNYLYQFLQFNPLIMEEYKRHFSILKDKLVKYPNKNSGEQQKIADCLSSIDEKINLQSQKLEILKEHKKALLQQLFPKL